MVYPSLKRQIQLLDQEGSQSEAYQALARRGVLLGILRAVIVFAIVYLMVVKPGLWM